MSVANATMSIMENYDANLFKQKFGFDMYTVKDGVKYYNFEALAMDMFLNNYSGNTMEQVILNSHGISNNDFINVFSDYFKNKGITLETNSTLALDNFSLEKENSFDFALDHKNENEVVITMGNGFDMQELFSKETSTSLSDGALANAQIEGNLIKNIGGHATTLVGFDSEKNYIVSSWGNKYLIPKNSATNLNLRSIKLFLNN